MFNLDIVYIYIYIYILQLSKSNMAAGSHLVFDNLFYLFIYLFWQSMLQQSQCMVKNVNMIKIHGCLAMLEHIGFTLLLLKAR